MIVQITPTYPPDVSGVGDYAALLELEFIKSGWPMRTHVARAGTWSSEGATALVRTDTEGLAAALHDTDQVLLHFSGYGYARRGLCRWLVDALAQWKAAGAQRRLVTMFHEVYATGPIWRSSFWTKLPQQWIARDLAVLSDAAFASSYAGQAQLKRLMPNQDVCLLPVFSTIGEPEALAPLAERADAAVVFGGVARRRSAYNALSGAVEALSRHFGLHGVKRILDIGPDMEVPEKIGGIKVARLGTLLAADLSDVLTSSRIGFIDYPGHVFTKSSIAAAYFSHRMLVVNTSSVAGFPPDLIEGIHFSRLEDFAAGSLPSQSIADAGYAWYQPHRLTTTARRLREFLS